MAVALAAVAGVLAALVVGCVGLGLGLSLVLPPWLLTSVGGAAVLTAALVLTALVLLAGLLGALGLRLGLLLGLGRLRLLALRRAA